MTLSRVIQLTKGHTLLSGNIFCAHCNSHMIASSWWDHYKRKDGTEVKKKRYRYLCYLTPLPCPKNAPCRPV